MFLTGRLAAAYAARFKNPGSHASIGRFAGP